MSSNGQPTVVVGVDGTSESLAALRWAADEAVQRRARLHVVRAWDPQFSAPYAPIADDWTRADQCAEAAAGLTTQLAAVFGPQLPDGVSSEITQGVAERVLVDRSAGASLLVLGSSSAPPAVGRAIGSVIRSCLRRAFCPVVVVSATEKPAGRTVAHLAELTTEGDRVALRELKAVLATDAGR
jgi:nucleotide-binding universal stress UspA family protein